MHKITFAVMLFAGGILLGLGSSEVIHAQMQGLATVPLLQQVFGLVVNTLNQGFSSVSISKETAANIINGT